MNFGGYSFNIKSLMRNLVVRTNSYNNLSDFNFFWRTLSLQ